jgi:hypothetical protein
VAKNPLPGNPLKQEPTKGLSPQQASLMQDTYDQTGGRMIMPGRRIPGNRKASTMEFGPNKRPSLSRQLRGGKR